MVQAFQQLGGSWERIASGTMTDLSGDYKLHLVAGAYKIGFFSSWDWDIDSLDTALVSKDATVIDDQITPNINAQLPEPAPPLIDVDMSASGTRVDVNPVDGRVKISQDWDAPLDIPIEIDASIACKDCSTPPGDNDVTLEVGVTPTQ